MADQNIKVRVSSSNSSTRYFYVRVQTGEGDNGSSWISVGNTNSSGSQISSSEFSTSKLHTGGSYPSYQDLELWWSSSEVTLSSSHQYAYQWPGSSSNYSADLVHPDNTYGSGTFISSSAYFLDITFPSSDPSSTGWGSWTQRNSGGTELDVTGPTSMTASFTGSTNTSIKLVFNESPRDSNGDKWTSSTVPGTGYDGFSFSPSDTAAISNFSVDSVAYSTTSVTDDTVTLGIAYDGSVDSGETLSFTLSKAVVYDSSGNQAASYGTFSSGTLSWPTTGSSGRTYYDRTFKITNSSSGAVYFLIGVDYGEGTNGGSYVQRGPLAAGQTASYTVNQVLMNDFEYSSSGSFSIYPFSSDQSSNLSSSFYPSGTAAYITAAQLNAATDGRLEYTWDGSSWSGPTVYDTNGNLVDISVATPTVTVANSGGSGTVTIDFGEKIYKSSTYGPSSFSQLSELGSSDVSSTYISNSGGDSDVEDVSVTGVSYDTSDDSGAMAIYGTDSTSNSYGTGWFYPVYLSDPGSSHQHTFSQYGSTVFYMPNSGSNHAQSQPPENYVHYHDQLVVSFTYSGTATTDDTMEIYFSSSTIYDANLNSGTLSVSGAMQADSSGGIDMSTKQNLNRLSVNGDFKPDTADTHDLGTDSKKWANLRLSDTVYLSGTSKLSIGGTAVTASAAEMNVLTGSGLVAADMSTLAGLALDGVTGLVQADFTKLAALDVSATELNLLDAIQRGSIVYGSESGSALLAKGDANTVLTSDGTDISYSQVTNAMLAGSIANSKLANSSVSFGGVSLALGASDATPAFDLSDATSYPTSSLVGTITNAQLAGSIANEKLSNSSVSLGGITVALGGSDATPAFDLSDATSYPTSSLVGTITNAQLAGSIANEKLSNSSVSLGGITVALGGSDATPAFDLSDATSYPTSSLVGTITNAQLAGSIANDKLSNSSVSLGGVSLALGGSDATPAFDLSDATSYPTSSLVGTITNAQLAGDIEISKIHADDLTLKAESFSDNDDSIPTTGAVKQYVDGVAQGLEARPAVRVATTAEITIASDLNVGDTIDGITLADGDRVLVKDQGSGTGDAKDNGIYIAGASPARADDMAAADHVKGHFFFVEEGTVNGDNGFVCTSDASADTVGTHDLSFVQFSGAGQIVAGAAMTKSGNTLDVAVDGSSIEVASDALQVKAGGITNDMLAGSIVAGKLAGSIGNDKLSNSSVSFGGVEVALGASDATPAFDLSDATSYPTSSLVGTITNAQLAGSIANGKLANSSVSFGGVSLELGGSDATPAFDLADATNYPTSSLVGTITNAQLAGSIANGKLANSSVSFGGVSLELGGSDATPAFDLSDATSYPTSSLVGTITNAQLAGSIANDKLANSSVSFGGVSLALGGSDATPAFDLSDATGLPISSGVAGLGTGIAAALASAIDTDISAVSSSDDTVASAKAIKTYVDAQITAMDLDFQGDSGGALSIDLDSEVLDIAGDGGAISTAGSENQITISAADASSSQKGVVTVGSGIQVSSGSISILMQRKNYVAGSTAGTHAVLSGTSRTMQVDMGDASRTYVAASLQVFHNGMLMKEGASGSGDYSLSSTSSGVFTVTLHPIDSSDPFAGGDTVSIMYLVS